MTDDYTVRPAQPADLDRLLLLFLALQDHLESSNPQLWRMRSEARAGLKSQLSARLRAEDGCALVAEHVHDGVIGMAFGRIASNSRYTPEQVGIIDQAFVRGDHRRRGVGSRLVAELCLWYAGQGVEDLSLRFVAGNEEAAGFWAALGFVPRIITVGAACCAVQARLEQARGL